jgi:hypothetical protein
MGLNRRQVGVSGGARVRKVSSPGVRITRTSIADGADPAARVAHRAPSVKRIIAHNTKLRETAAVDRNLSIYKQVFYISISWISILFEQYVYWILL